LVIIVVISISLLIIHSRLLLNGEVLMPHRIMVEDVLKFKKFDETTLIGKSFLQCYDGIYHPQNIALKFFEAVQEFNTLDISKHFLISVSEVSQKMANHLEIRCHHTIHTNVVFIDSDYTLPSVEILADKLGFTTKTWEISKQTITEFPGGYIISSIW
jgi:hypothetical protein